MQQHKLEFSFYQVQDVQYALTAQGQLSINFYSDQS